MKALLLEGKVPFCMFASEGELKQKGETDKATHWLYSPASPSDFSYGRALALFSKQTKKL